tara:strand:- start:16 stop:600 length:585 start_codon:yes stop_codon:yes gene_type:complete
MTVEDVLDSINDGSYYSRCSALRDLCPCRNNSNRDVEVWEAIFDKARDGRRRERNAAAHAIGTLIEKSAGSDDWRDVVHQLDGRIEELMGDPRAAEMLLGQMKRHGHARRGTASRNLRRVRQLTAMPTASELAAWVSEHPDYRGEAAVDAGDEGVRRLEHWIRQRVRFQPRRKTSEAELLKMARRFLPRAFGIA